jgi:hypothetical protein
MQVVEVVHFIPQVEQLELQLLVAVMVQVMASELLAQPIQVVAQGAQVVLEQLILKQQVDQV